MRKLRVPLPRFCVAGMLTLANKILEKHMTDGAESLLINLNLNEFRALVEKAAKLDEEKDTLRKRSEQRTLERDAAMKEIELKIRKTRDVLTGIHLENMKRLTDWGFDVIESSAPKTL